MRSRSKRTAVAFGADPAVKSLASLARKAEKCRNCELWEHATQVVFGDGAPRARVMLVGEQPGDVEDQQGRPFVGPAGRILSAALKQAGLELASVYLTNVVKHFRWEERGKRRIHKKPGLTHIRACRPWLDAEVATVRPKVLVCLGSVAAQSILGPSVRVTRDAGMSMPTDYGVRAVVTLHPSAVLRATDRASRLDLMHRLVEHLKLARSLADD